MSGFVQLSSLLCIIEYTTGMDQRDFLRDDLFIYWRLHPSKKLDAFWESFILNNEDCRDSLNDAIDTFDKISKTKETDQIDDQTTSLYQELKERIKKSKQNQIRKILTSSIAAAVLLALVISTSFFILRNAEKAPIEISSIGEVMSKNNIQLLSGNTVSEIHNNSTLDLSEKKQSAMVQNQSNQKEINLNSSQINKLIVPYGKQSTLILSDGSKVHLNSGSIMEFPTSFASYRREVSVEGEIFIDVTEDSDSPFIIHTLHSQITVYGTSLNVSSYSEDVKESVVLVNGSVEVKSQNNTILLKPNEMAEIKDGEIVSKLVDVLDYIGWTNGYLQLNKAPLDEVLKKIGRYYNVEFTHALNKELYEQTCSGKLFLSDDLNDILEAFSKMTFLQYEKQNDKRIFIYK